MTSAQIIIVVTIVAYLFGMLLIGVIFNRQGAADTSDGFYIGGRSLGPLVTAMSAEASDMSSYLLMGLIGLIMVMIINIFVKSSGLDLLLSVVGVLIFVGLTAYDTQKIKVMAAMNTGYEMSVLGLWGALSLYLDFINLFLYLLRIFGNRD